MPTFDNRESLASVRTKINAAITKVDGITVPLATLNPYATFAAMIADATLTPAVCPVGTRVQANGFWYEATSDAVVNGYPFEGAGGVKLKVLLDSSGWLPFEAFGWDKTGATDALAKMNAAIAYMKALGLVKIWVGSNGTLNLSADPTDYKYVYLAGSDITITGGTTTDFNLHDRIDQYLTDPAASGSVGGSGNNRSWKRTYSGSPALHVWERTDVPGNDIVWGTIQANHDGFLICAGSTTDGKKLVLGVKEDQEDEGCFEAVNVTKENIIFNPARRGWDIRFYCTDRANAAVMNGATGEFTFNGGSAGSILINGNSADSVARVGLINDAQNFEVRTASVGSADEFQIRDATAGAARMRLSTTGDFGFGMAPVNTIRMVVAADSSHIFRGYNSAGTVEQITIQPDGDIFNVNGTYGTASDAKLKTDIQDARSQWEDIKAVRLRNFRLKSQGDDGPEHLGVVAQELQAAGMGGLVKETEEDGETTLTVKTSILLMKALGALQEAQARIEALEARLPASR